MTDEKKPESDNTEPKPESTESNGGTAGSGPTFGSSTQGGPNFEQQPDPLAGVKKAGGEAWKATEGKTVSMRTYIGSIIAVIVLMLLARCGG